MQKDWNWFDFLSFWMSDVHSIGGYVMAGALFAFGLPPLQIFSALVVGSVLVAIFATLVAVPSQRMGVPFAVVIRRAFGVRAGMVPAAIRAVIAMAWYGIQTWLASNAVCLLLVRLIPSLGTFANSHQYGVAGLSGLGWVCFLTLWLVQMVIFRRGVETIRRFFDFAVPAVYGVMLALLVYLLWCNHWAWSGSGFATHAFHGSALTWVGAAALVVSYFSGPMLNFGDFARKGRGLRQIVIGNVLGLPVNFVFFAGLSVATTSLTVPVFGAAMDDPVAIVGHIENPAIVAIAILTFLVATAGINIAANFVSGALDLCALAPGRLHWGRAGWIFGVGAICLTPWNLYNSPASMHATLDVLAAAVGPVFGILVAEYHVVARLRSLHAPEGTPVVALLTMLLAGAAAFMPEILPRLAEWQSFSWFVGAALGAVLYIVLTLGRQLWHSGSERLHGVSEWL